jgi:hypothetical protein
VSIPRVPLVDPTNGNITIHGRAGASIPVTFKDNAGAARDVTAAALFFEVDGILRIALAAGPTSDVRTLALSRAQVASLGTVKRNFACIDESTGTPSVFWSGVIQVFGYTDAPA